MKEREGEPVAEEILGETPISGIADDGAPSPAPTPRKARSSWRRAAFVLVGLGILGGLAFEVKWYFGPADAVVTADARVKGDFTVVRSTIRGRIDLLSVQEGDRVEKGQTVAQLVADESRAEADRASAKIRAVQAEFDDAKAALSLAYDKREKIAVQTENQLRQARERLERARAEEQRASARMPDNRRYVTYQAGPNYVHDMVEARRAREYFKGEQERAKKEISAGEARLKAVRADPAEIAALKEKADALNGRLAEVQAELSAANRKLASAAVASPISGMVAKITGRTGETVEPSQPIAMILNLDQIWVEAQVREADYGYIRPGQPVELKAAAFPHTSFTGKVVNVGVAVSSELARLPDSRPPEGEVKPGQSIPVKIAVDDPQRLLKPGMTMTAKFVQDTGNESPVGKPGGG
jgi:membrane fusion protein, multidrug efflux system